MEAGKLVISTEMDTSMLDKEIEFLQDRLEGLESELETIQNSKPFENQANEVKKLYNEIDTTRSKLQRLIKKKQELDDTSSSGFKDFISNLGSNLDVSFGKITRIGLAMMGLRAGLALIRTSVRTIADTNTEIGGKIEMFKSALANALTPIVSTLVDLIYKFLYYTNYVLKAWFGIDLFANSTSKSTKKMKNNIGGANKEANKLKRTLAGFDEMNILNKDGGVSVGGGGGGISTPEIDTSSWKDIEVPKWVQWIADNKDVILGTLKDIALWVGVAFGTLKLLEFAGYLTKIQEGLVKLIPGLEGMSGLKIFGILAGVAVTLVGVVQSIEAIIKFIGDPSWTNFGDVIDGLSTLVLGLGTAMAFFNAQNPVGWILIAVGVVGKFSSSLWEENEATKTTEYTQRKLNEAIQNFINKQNTYVDAIEAEEKAHKNLVAIEKKNKESGEALYKSVLMGTTTYEKMTPKQQEVYKAYLKYIGASENAKKATQELESAQKDEIKAMVEHEAVSARETQNYEELEKTIATLWKNRKLNAGEVQQALIEAFDGVSEESRKTFEQKLPSDLQKSLNELYKFQKQLKDITAKKWNVGITTTYSYTGQKVYKKGGIVPFAKGGVIPKLAPGGIINRPGPGIAIGGEAGAEGVIPLTDSQQMARLGSAIGKYVNIRNEVPVYLGNRLIAREINNVNAQETFAYNG